MSLFSRFSISVSCLLSLSYILGFYIAYPLRICVLSLSRSVSFNPSPLSLFYLSLWLSPTLWLSLSLFHSVSLNLCFLSLPLSQRHSHSLSLLLPHTHSLSLSHSVAFSLFLSLSLLLLVTHTLSHSVALFLFLSLTPSLSYSFTFSPPLTLSSLMLQWEKSDWLWTTLVSWYLASKGKGFHLNISGTSFPSRIKKTKQSKKTKNWQTQSKKKKKKKFQWQLSEWKYLRQKVALTKNKKSNFGFIL